MKLSLQFQYAVCGVFDLAYNGQGEPVQIRVISERQGIPARYLEQIFQRLRRARLVQSKRGPGGGYTLARRPGDITLRDVVEAVEGPLGGQGAKARRGEGDKDSPTLYRPSFLWPMLSEGIAEVLARTTVEGLCREAQRSSVRRAHSDVHMYFI
ncbi:MAG TPA: transcriptional regulator [Deltaproteobacteria bacterium]|jgi:Rrf2 family protein|nr:transcriptional regulator [Deltaproteobacteria bacterium]